MRRGPRSGNGRRSRSRSAAPVPAAKATGRSRETPGLEDGDGVLEVSLDGIRRQRSRRRTRDDPAVEGELAVVAGAPDDAVRGNVLDGATLVRALRGKGAQLVTLLLDDEDPVRAEPCDQETRTRELLLLRVGQRDLVGSAAVTQRSEISEDGVHDGPQPGDGAAPEDDVDPAAPREAPASGRVHLFRSQGGRHVVPAPARMQGLATRATLRTPLIFSAPMKVAFIGTHGVGKTTLCYDLAAALKKRDLTVELVREVARECPLPINQETTLKAQAWILHTQIAWELQAEAKADVVFCDRSVLDNFCYMRRAFTGAPAEAVLEELVRSWTKSYDALFKVPIVGDPRFDGVRDTDLTFQREIDGSIEQTLAVWGVPHVPLDPARRGEWGALVLDVLLPRLRPQELLFPEPGERLNTTGVPDA